MIDTLPANGTVVTASTYPSIEYDRDAQEVTGRLSKEPVEIWDAIKCWVDGVQVDPATVKEIKKSNRRTVQKAGTCKPGERSDLTGCTPASGEGGTKKPKVPRRPRRKPKKKPPVEEKPKDVLPTPGTTMVHDTVLKAKQVISELKDKLDKVTDVKVLRQVKQVSAFVQQRTQKFNAFLVNRYGKTGALAVYASGQALGWGVFGAGLAVGVPLWLPGASIWGNIPGAMVAEGVLQLSRAIKRKKAEPEPLDKHAAERIWKEFATKLAEDYAKHLEKLGITEDTIPEVTSDEEE